MIYFDKENNIFHLQTPNTSYIFGLLGKGTLTHIYYGKRINNTTGIFSKGCKETNFCVIDSEFYNTDTKFTTDVLRQDYSFFGSTDMRIPAFHAEYKDGSRITKPTYVSHKIFGGKPKLVSLPATYTESEEEADTLEITMRDNVWGLTLIYRYTAFNTCDAITRSVTVKNEGKEDVDLKSVLSFSIDFNRDDFDFVNLCGAWARERHVERRHLGTGTTRIESRRGSSSHFQSPFFALCDKNADEEKGDVYGFSLVYSGNFEAGVEVDTYGQTRAFMGVNSFDFGYKLKNGEEFNTPEAVLVYSHKGFGDMSYTYHNLYRKRLARGNYRDAKRPILINNWEATYFDFNEEKILNIAKKAKEAGIEMLVIDDGWFGKRNDDTTSLGDWYPFKEKLPGGICGIAEKVVDTGLNFGLWIEPEMVSPDSDLYRAHPDWCLHVKNRERDLGRNQLILDLSRGEVCDYIVSFLTDILKSAPISYIKWDMNRNMACVGSAELSDCRQKEVSYRYMLGLYGVLERITSAFPDVLFEGCSGGGGRFDAGMMHYFNQYWTSDDSDATERMYIQYGTSFVMPSCFMAAHVSAVPNHQVQRVTPLKTRGHVAMGGQLGYELDVTKMTNEELIEIKSQIEEYKSIRDIVHNGRMYRTISPFEGKDCSWCYVSDDKSAAVLFYFTIQTNAEHLPKNIKFKGLLGDALYKIKGEERVLSGDVLMNIGIETDHVEDCESSMVVIERV